MTTDSKSSDTQPTGRGEWILVVDDDREIAALLKDFLELEGFHVMLARDGEEGEQIFISHTPPFDLIVTDLGMPKVGGVEFFKRVRAIRPDARVIASSGYGQHHVVSQLLRDGAKAFIPKPYLPQDLLKTIRRVLDQS